MGGIDPGWLVVITITMVVLGVMVLDLYNESALRKFSRAGASCGVCGFGATPDMLTRGRCPECGAMYVVGGVDSARLAIGRRVARKWVYARFVCGGLWLGSVLAAVCALLVGGLGRVNVGWWPLVAFLAGVVCLGMLPCAWVWSNRSRAMRTLRGRVAAEQALEQAARQRGQAHVAGEEGRA
ncbi:MAG: hypothetical protein MUE97_01935 [Phycisphaerales bacterium]|jgi:hypothetical protein|nr:hypothetical protein [Phycisphaerales bacterium]